VQSKKISQILLESQKELADCGLSNSYLESLILLGHILEYSKEQIISNSNQEIDIDKLQEFSSLIKRRKNREPISHLINKREFYSLDFFVNEDVLDPRGDSESLVELVFDVYKDRSQKLDILEIGVGSGCLIITLLTKYLKASGVALDISEKSILVAKKNAKTHQVLNRIDFKISDIFSNANSKFDLIISNPPYIKSDDIENLQDEVRLYEPKGALDGGKDGLDFYRKIALNARAFLKTGGNIILEIGMNQDKDVIDIFKKQGFDLVGVKKDLSSITRSLCFS